jgi:hypothetical protein
VSDAYADAQDVTRQLREASRALRDLPKETVKVVKARARAEVVAPLVAAVQAAAPRPWAVPLRKAIRPATGQVPGIDLGSGPQAVASRGARGRDLIPGVEWGGGGGYSLVTRPTKKTGRKITYKRRITAMFGRHKHPFVYAAIADHGPKLVQAYLDMLDEAMTAAGVPDGPP